VVWYWTCFYIIGLAGVCWPLGILAQRILTVIKHGGPAESPFDGERCARCAYLLYGLPEERCPECGLRFVGNGRS
jgi:hypothetical protein